MLPIRSLKQFNEHNPLPSHGFCAEPSVLVYDGRVYLYLSSEKPKLDKYGKPKNNNFAVSVGFRVMSSTDMVNWTDHGEMLVAGKKGAAAWAKRAAAPCVVCREENGHDRFYMYFDDCSYGIGVLTSDSPLGPFTDALGCPLVDKQSPGCAGVPWIADPAVVIDEGGAAYLYFGGGDQDDAPNATKSSARAVKLGADMTSLDGEPVMLDLPYYYEASGVNAIDGKYVHSYCTVWNIPDNDKEKYGIDSACIACAVSSDPLGPFEPRGTLLKNPGAYFGCYGNSHHQLFEYRNKWYIAYQSTLRERAMGWSSDYRCAMLNEITRRADGGFDCAEGTTEGVSILEHVNPYLSQSAAMCSDFAGAELADTGGLLCASPSVKFESGGWIRISGVDFGSHGSSRFHCTFRNPGKPGHLMIVLDSLNTVPAAVLRTGRSADWTEKTVELSTSVTGVHEVFIFSAADHIELKEWRFEETAAAHRETKYTAGANPIIPCDCPDPDVIRVGDVYYMVTTTMHFMPACAILRSWDLLNWEFAGHVAPALEDTPAQRMEDGRSIYGQGMWAASLRYCLGTFFVCFVERDTGKTRLYRSNSIKGPWRFNELEGYYYDSSLLFDDDGKVYIVHGHATIRITELNDELTAPRKNGLNRVLVREKDNKILPYEGAHMHKINGQYYLFLIHSLSDRWMRTEACFRSATLNGRFIGGDVLCDDMGFFEQGVAQGGLIDTPYGDWYAMLFQDRGAVGRLPILVPVRWENGMPILGENGKAPKEITVRTGISAHPCAPLYGSDKFDKPQLANFWEWNHLPDNTLWALEGGGLRLSTGTVSKRLTEARNTLTQRTVYPRCSAEVTLDASNMNDGDAAGLCALQGDYAWVGLVKERGMLTMRMYCKQNGDIIEGACIPWSGSRARLRIELDFTDLTDTAVLYCVQDGSKRQLGEPHPLVFRLDHFTGCRFGLFMFSTVQPGGSALFSDFVYAVPREG